jgi:hypothetical protein
MKRKTRKEMGGSASGGDLSFSSSSMTASGEGRKSGPGGVGGQGGGQGGLLSSDDDPLDGISLSRSIPGTKSENLLVEEDTRKLEMLASYLAASKKTTSSIVAVLESVEDRISQVENDIMTVYKVSSQLRTTNNNVNGALAEMDQVFANFHVETEIQMVINDGPAADLGVYLEMMAKLDETIGYFETNKRYKSSAGALKQLRGLKNKAVEACERLYSDILEKCSVPMDPTTQFPSPIPKELNLIDESDKEQLLMLAEVLGGSIVFTRDYVECRARFLNGTIRKMPILRRDKVVAKKSGAVGASETSSSSNRLPAIGSASSNVDSPQMGASMMALPQLSDDGSEDMGKQFGEFTLVFLRVAEHERRLALEVFGQNSGNYFHQVFGAVFEASFELFVRLAETTIKMRPRNVPEVERVFDLLDIYDELSGRLKPLNQITRVGENTFRDRVTGVVDMFRAAVKHHLTFFLENVQRDNVKVGSDGNVHPMSSRTLNYVIKRMLPKRTCVEFLVDKWLDVSTVSLEVIILTICNELCLNLEEKAKRVEKKHPILANIFLLNNYHYILHTVSNNNMLPPDLLPTFSANYETKIYNEIATYRASWNQCIEYLIDSDPQQKAAQISSADYKQIKAKFSGFNKALEKLFHSQKMYTIPNNSLRQELRELAKSIVLPLYKTFIEKYENVPFTKNRSKYEQYTLDTLVGILNTFFCD